MLRQVIAITLALIAAAFLTIAFLWIVFVGAANSRGIENIQTLLALVLMVVLAYVFWRAREWPAFLLFVGSIPVFVFRLHVFVLTYLLDHDLASPLLVPSSGFTRVEAPWIFHFVLYFMVIAISLPVAAFWYCYRAMDRYLKKSASS